MDDPSDPGVTRDPEEHLPGERAPEVPGERAPAGRRLAEPPSARYGPSRATAPADHRGIVGRAFARAAFVALLGAAAIFILEGLLSITTGLLAAMALTGYAIGRSLRNAGDALAASASTALALFLVVDAVVLGNAFTWVNAVVVEGGVLGPIEYLSETFGLLIVVELAIGTVTAWAAARR